MQKSILEREGPPTFDAAVEMLEVSGAPRRRVAWT